MGHTCRVLRQQRAAPTPANGTHYQQLCDDIRAGVVDRVAVWDLDRLHRLPAELEAFIALAEQHHVELANVGGDVDLSTPAGRLFARMKGAVAKHETEHKSARFRRANLQRAQAGKNATWYGQRMFGYDGNQLVAHEADAIRAATSRCSTERHWVASPSSGTTRDCGRCGRKAWTGATVRQLLKRERNAGLQVYQGEILEGVTTSSPADHRARCVGRGVRRAGRSEAPHRTRDGRPQIPAVRSGALR